VDGLAGRVALVTGGGRGIGAAIALALADAGCDVAALARSHDDVERVAGAVRDRGRRGHPVTCDVTDPAALDAALRSVRDALGAVEVAIVAAGRIEPLGSTTVVDAGEWMRTLDVNVVGVLRVVQAVVPAMVERGWGRLVTISSGAASPPGMPSASAYSASKAALDMLTVQLADELRGTGVTANAIRPGVVDTPMQELMRSMPAEQVGERFYDRFHGLYERGELLAPEVPARFVVALLATQLTGEILDVRDPAATARVTAAS
jgi:NAD(P)-dependent dehydrogenase (short-subunit alcohol dehydrogenase family)